MATWHIYIDNVRKIAMDYIQSTQPPYELYLHFVDSESCTNHDIWVNDCGLYQCSVCLKIWTPKALKLHYSNGLQMREYKRLIETRRQYLRRTHLLKHVYIKVIDLKESSFIRRYYELDN